MGGSLEAFKLFLASEKKRQDRADERLQQQQQPQHQVNDTTAESTSGPSLADTSKADIQASASTTAPAEVAAVVSQPAMGEISTEANAEAGASLNHVVSTA